MQQIDNSRREQILFSYNRFSSPERHNLQQAAREIRQNINTTIQAIWKTGQKLVEVRLQLEESMFSAWLQSEFEWSRRTAYHYINVYEAFPQLDTQQSVQLDIDLSALYLLAAPSTSAELRSHFFAIAHSGQRVRHREVKAFLQHTKAISVESQFESEAIATVSLALPKHISECQDDEDLTAPEVIGQSISALHPAWNLVDDGFSLYWGDIFAPKFNAHLPDEAFVLATPSMTWQQDWLVKNTRSSIALDKSQLDRKIVSGFLSVIADRQKAIVFPWLPKWQIVKIALDLKLEVYAAGMNLPHCERLVSQLGFDLQRIQRIWK